MLASILSLGTTSRTGSPTLGCVVLATTEELPAVGIDGVGAAGLCRIETVKVDKISAISTSNPKAISLGFTKVPRLIKERWRSFACGG